MRRFIKEALLLVGITVVPLMLFNFIVDPLQCHRQATWYAPLFDPNQRMQNACLARTQQYNTVIMGTSHVENFDPIHVNEALGTQTLRLATAGSTLHEQKTILNLALTTGRVERIVWGLDTNLLYDGPETFRDDITPFPHYIYKRTGLILYLLDPYLIKHYTKMAAHRLFGAYSQYTDLRYLNSWRYSNFSFGESYVIDRFHRIHAARTENAANGISFGPMIKDADAQTNMMHNVVHLVETHPDVHFDIVFPPFSILRYVSDQEWFPEYIENEFKAKALLIDTLLPFSNVTMHEFQSESDITHNLNNYKDLTHFSGDVNDIIIEAIARGTHMLAPETDTGTSVIDALQGQIDNYQLPYYTRE